MYNYYPYTRIPNNYINYNMYSSFPKKGLFSKFNLNSFLNGTNKTLNVINQAIPIYKQVKPMISNAKTMFKVMKAVKTTDSTEIKNIETKAISNTNNPTFFI